MAIAAPSAAPDAVPSTNGSASGLRSRPWKVAPATASPAPTTIAVSTRGRRSSHTIVSAAGDQVAPVSMPRVRDRMTPSVSAGLMRTVPRPTPATSRMTRATIAATPTTQRRPAPPPAGTAGGGEVAGDGGRCHRRVGPTVPTAAGTSGRIAAARLRRPMGRRGPGRVISVSWTGRIAPSLTAVMTSQPGRAATSSGVGT